MTPSQRILKQVLILIIFLAILGGLGYLGYLKFETVAVTPTPNPVTQLQPVQIVQIEVVPVDISSNDYDFWAKVRNPNTNYGSSNVSYTLTFTNDSGGIVSQQNGTMFILPGETRSIVETPLRFSTPVSQAEIKINQIDWQKVNPLFSGVQLISRNIAYTASNQPGVAATVSGDISNDSDFDFNMVDVLITVRNSNGTLIGVTKTNIQTFLSQTTRSFRVSWPAPLAENIDPASLNISVEAYTNVFDNLNFIQRFAEPERFQNSY